MYCPSHCLVMGLALSGSLLLGLAFDKATAMEAHAASDPAPYTAMTQQTDVRPLPGSSWALIATLALVVGFTQRHKFLPQRRPH
jgi:hypothetical protein